MKNKKILALVAVTVLVSGLVLVDVVRATTDTTVGSFLDLEIANNTLYKSGFTNLGAFVEYLGDSNTTFGSSGTGTFDSFVRLQKSPTESGYNTNGTLEFDSKSGTWTHAIRVSDIPVVMLDTVDGNLNTLPNNLVPAWELFADLNEANNDSQISLDKLEVWFADNANVTGYTSNFSGQAAKVYDFSGKININDVNQGSGRGDLRYSIPTSLAGGVPTGCDYGSSACNKYFVLYTKFGNIGADAYDSEGGFEEWKVKQYPTLQVVKNTVGGNETFNFTVSGPTASAPSITTVGGTGATSSNIVTTGTYTITEGSTQGWEFQNASCSTNGGTPVSYTPGSSISVAGSNSPAHVVCTFVNSKLQPLTVQKTANTAYNKTWNWTIAKTATPATQELFDGETGTSNYAVTATKTGSTETDYSVTGTIIIHNPNLNTSATVTGVSDVLSDSTNATVTCPSSVVPANGNLVCTYAASPSGKTSNLNTAIVTTDGNVPGNSGTAVVDWSSATVTEVNGSVNVNDTFDSGDFGPVSTTTTHNYSETFTCGLGDSQYAGTNNVVPNTATITETGASANASVIVKCYTPTVTKTAVPAVHQTY